MFIKESNSSVGPNFVHVLTCLRKHVDKTSEKFKIVANSYKYEIDKTKRISRKWGGLCDAEVHKVLRECCMCNNNN